MSRRPESVAVFARQCAVLRAWGRPLRSYVQTMGRSLSTKELSLILTALTDGCSQAKQQSENRWEVEVLSRHRLFRHPRTKIHHCVTVKELDKIQGGKGKMAGGPDKADQGSFDNDVWKLLQTASSNAPASGTSTGYAGQLAFDGTNLYICIAANSWKKIAHSSI